MAKKVLVIDDELSVLKFMNNVLTREGYDVLIASNGLEGLDLARKELPDLVITDVRMPILNGYMVIKELRNDPKYKHIPIVIITGYEIEESDRKEAESYGVTTYFQKPFEIDEVLEKIKEILKEQP